MGPPADPDTLRQMSDAAHDAVEHGSDVAAYWPGIGAAIGAAYLFVSRKVGSGRVVAALREEMSATRHVLHREGNEMRKELGELKESIAHLTGRIEGYRCPYSGDRR